MKSLQKSQVISNLSMNVKYAYAKVFYYSVHLDTVKFITHNSVFPILYCISLISRIR